MLLKDALLKRNKWPTGVIVYAIPSQDLRVRKSGGKGYQARQSQSILNRGAVRGGKVRMILRARRWEGAPEGET